jgi:cobalt-zinc-cadmium efflux system membrane fusion protein
VGGFTGDVMLIRKRLYASIGTAGVVVLGGLAFHYTLSPSMASTAHVNTNANAVQPAPAVPNAVNVSREALGNMSLHFVTAERRPLVRTVQVTGLVSFNAKRLAQVSSPSRGRVESIDVVVGQHVHGGQRLAVLDDFDLSDVSSQVASAQAAVADATSAAATAHVALTRGTELLGIGAMAQSELERRRAMDASAQATLHSRQAELEKWLGMRQRLQPTGSIVKSGESRTLAQLGPRESLGAVVAPFDGVINAVGTAPGDIVDTSLQLFTVADLSTVWVQANVPERELSVIEEGDTVTVSVDAYPGRQFSGHVAYIADQVDPNTGTVAVRCDVPNPDGALRANMFATANIAAPLGRDAVLVPDAALQDVDGQTAVFIPSGTGHFTRQVVHTGVSSGGFTEILDGVTAGKQIVTDGSYWLKADFLQNAIPDEG